MAEIPVSLLYRLLSLQWDYCVELTEDHAQILKKRGTEKLPFSKIRSKAAIRDGLIWDNIIFEAPEQGRFTISGIKKAQSEQSIATLNHLIGQLNNTFALDVLPEQEKSIVTKFLALFSKSHEIREKQNRKFVHKELTNYQEFSDTVENNPLTESPRLACVVNEDNNLVLAGAGSGKTSVIIAKAGYLIRSGSAKPHEILILAYGRKANQETDERIREKLPHIEGVTTSTFHKLGLDIIGQVTGEKPRVSKLQEDAAEFYKLINGIITELTKLEKAYNQRVIDYFVTHLIPYKDEFDYSQQGDYFTALKEGDLQSIKSRIEWAEIRSGRKSLQQETLKSFEEVVIADFLFVNGIKYHYEHPYEIPTATAERPQYVLTSTTPGGLKSFSAIPKGCRWTRPFASTTRSTNSPPPSSPRTQPRSKRMSLRIPAWPPTPSPWSSITRMSTGRFSTAWRTSRRTTRVHPSFPLVQAISQISTRSTHSGRLFLALLTRAPTR